MSLFTAEDQAWLKDWVRYVDQQVTKESLPRQHGFLAFRAEASEGKILTGYKARDRDLGTGTYLEWSPMLTQDGLPEARVKELFWRQEDALHLKQWVARYPTGTWIFSVLVEIDSGLLVRGDVKRKQSFEFQVGLAEGELDYLNGLPEEETPDDFCMYGAPLNPAEYKLLRAAEAE
jgi:hypothetical protein